MADNMIELVASLNVDDSAKQINTVDIPKLQKKIEGIKIKCELDTEGISSIQSQLANISKNSKLDIPKVEVQTDARQSGQNIENVAKSVETVTNKVLTLKKTLADLDGKFVEAFKAVENPDGIINAERTMAVIQSRLSSLGTVTVTGKYNDQESEDSINKIIARIEAASGEVRELNFLLDSTGQKFEYIGGSYSDKGVGKIQQDLARLSKELANFEASHKSIESGLIEPLTTARNAIIDLESGVGSVESAQKALDNLKTVAANIGSNLKSTGSSFNVFDNAANKAKNFDNTIKTLKMDIESLSPSANKSSLVSQLDLAIERMNAFKDAESKSGRGIEWSQRYGEISSLLQNITNNLKVAQKEEVTFNKEFERELEIEERINKEKEKTFNKEFEKALKEEQQQLAIEQKRVEVARQLREEQQHDYWQGRFEESVKEMTAENQVLKDMKKYYEDLNKAQKEVEKQEKKTFQEDNKLANLQNRIKRLTADVNSYATANKKAVESTKLMTSGRSFADEWSRITSVMAKGASLTDRELKDLATDMAVFKKEAKSAGLEGASAFERFANSFKVISTYISANQIINRLTSYISSAVDELRNIDDILTEISKTSDITTENLKELGYASYDAASAYGRVASDYLLGVQEFSRAGYDEASAKSMAELSLKAQAAGDMTAEMANQYIIATGAAYQLSDNENELNKVLDSQNYITNHNAINMEQLASATKLVASQAASSGVGIDEMTAAVGTMSATTQQAGEVSGRAFKGILMNLQQVKGAAEDIGDGGEDITEESLSKYEKASEALGVSLKEIKNGTLQLRNPMEVLRDLAKEVEKEGESSLKVANLVAAIGGKYRGNSLIALLRNWDTYEKMLSEFNSTDAVGSAMDEAAKSANNWNGQINKLKNTWTELVNRFISSDDAIALIGSLNDLITSISDDKNISTLSNLAKTLQNIFVLVSNLSTKIGTLPTLIGGLGFISSLKSGDSILKIFSTVEDKTSSLGRSFTVLGKTGGLSLNSLTTGLTKAKIASVGLQVATAALNATITLGLSLAISAVIAGISKLINKEKEAQEQAKKRAEEAKARRKEAVESIKSYDDEVTAIQDLVSQYVKIVSSTSDLSVEKEKLLSIQDQIIDKYGAEAEGIDLVNGKLEDNINLLLQSQEEKNKQWQRENYQAVEDAEKYFKDRDLTLTNFVVGLDTTGMMDRRAREKAERYVSVMKKAFEEAGVGDLFNFEDYTSKTGANMNGRLMETERTYSVRLKKGLSVEQQKRALEAYEDVYNRILEKQKKYDGVIFSFGGKRHQQLNSIIDTFTGYYDILKQNKEIEESNLSIDQILGNVDDLQKYKDTLSDLTTLSQKINSEDYTPTQKYGFFQQITEGKEAINELIQQYPALRDIAVAALENIGLSADGVVQSETDLFESFYEALDDGHKKAIGNISTIEKAMETLSKGESVSHDDAWAMLRLDTEGLLGVPTITSTGEYKFKIQNLIKFKDSYIEKTKESIQADIEEAQTSRETTLQKIEDRKAELQAINDVISAQAIGNSKPSDEIISQQREVQLAISNLEDVAKNYGDEIERDNILLREYNSHLGNTISTEAQAENLRAQAENLLKAQENKIDDIVESLKNEKETLQNQLDVLNEQKEALEDILNKYETISSVVSDFMQKQIDSLEKQKSEIEDTYNAQIEKLQEANDERESAIALIEKQNALENAQNNKVRYYDETRGYVYGVDKEQLQNAQNDLDSALSEQTIKNLEKERDERTAMFDAQIEALEDYAEMWDSVIDDIKSAGDEQLASEVLGENWRTELAAMNIDIYNRFEADYTAYNDQLQRLTDGEITSLENAIKAKEDEIDSWSDYKAQIQNAAKEIEDSLASYENKLNDVALTEQSSYSDRIANLSDFVAQYSALMSGMTNIDMSSMFANVGSNILSAFNGARSLFGNGANLVGASQSLVFNINKVVSESPEAFVKAMETYAKNLKIKWEVSK